MARATKPVLFTMTESTLQRLEELACLTGSSRSKALSDLIWDTDIPQQRKGGSIYGKRQRQKRKKQ